MQRSTKLLWAPVAESKESGRAAVCLSEEMMMLSRRLLLSCDEKGGGGDVFLQR